MSGKIPVAADETTGPIRFLEPASEIFLATRDTWPRRSGSRRTRRRRATAHAQTAGCGRRISTFAVRRPSSLYAHVLFTPLAADAPLHFRPIGGWTGTQDGWIILHGLGFSAATPPERTPHAGQ